MKKSLPHRFLALFLAFVMASDSVSAAVLFCTSSTRSTNAFKPFYTQQAFLQPIVLGSHLPFLFRGGRQVLHQAAERSRVVTQRAAWKPATVGLGTFLLWQAGLIPDVAFFFAGLMAFHKNGHNHMQPQSPWPEEFLRALQDSRYERLLNHARIVIVNFHRQGHSIAAKYVAPYLRMTGTQLGNMIHRRGWGNYATLKAWALHQDPRTVPVMDLSKPRVQNTVDIQSDFLGRRPRGPYSRPSVKPGISPTMKNLLERSSEKERLDKVRRAFRALILSSQPKPIRIDTVAFRIPMPIPEFVEWMKGHNVDFDQLWAWALTTLPRKETQGNGHRTQASPTAKMLLFGIDPTMVMQYPGAALAVAGISWAWNSGWLSAAFAWGLLGIMTALIPPRNDRWRMVKELRKEGWLVEDRGKSTIGAWIPSKSDVNPLLWLTFNSEGEWEFTAKPDDPLQDYFSMNWDSVSKTVVLLRGQEKWVDPLTRDPLQSFHYKTRYRGVYDLRFVVSAELWDKLSEKWRKPFEIRKAEALIRVILDAPKPVRLLPHRTSGVVARQSLSPRHVFRLVKKISEVPPEVVLLAVGTTFLLWGQWIGLLVLAMATQYPRDDARRARLRELGRKGWAFHEGYQGVSANLQDFRRYGLVQIDMSYDKEWMLQIQHGSFYEHHYILAWRKTGLLTIHEGAEKQLTVVRQDPLITLRYAEQPEGGGLLELLVTQEAIDVLPTSWLREGFIIPHPQGGQLTIRFMRTPLKVLSTPKVLLMAA